MLGFCSMATHYTPRSKKTVYRSVQFFKNTCNILQGSVGVVGNSMTVLWLIFPRGYRRKKFANRSQFGKDVTNNARAWFFWSAVYIWCWLVIVNAADSAIERPHIVSAQSDFCIRLILVYLLFIRLSVDHTGFTRHARDRRKGNSLSHLLPASDEPGRDGSGDSCVRLHAVFLRCIFPTQHYYIKTLIISKWLNALLSVQCYEYALNRI